MQFFKERPSVLQKDQNCEAILRIGPSADLSVNHHQQSIDYSKMGGCGNAKEFFIAAPQQEDSWASVSESDSQDSVVSFEDEALDEHIFCSRFLFQKLQIHVFKHFATHTLAFIQDECLEPTEMDLMDYLRWQQQLMGPQNTALVLRILSEQPKLSAFLQWVYDATPQIYLREVIMVFQRIVLIYYESFKALTLSLAEILEVVKRPQFLMMIYGGEGIKTFQFHKYCNQISCAFEDDLPTLQQFMGSFTLTVVLVIQNFHKHPYYQRVKQLRRMELEKRFHERKKLNNRLRKKIKKRRLPEH